ncbi:MAG: hypothetical protein GX910_00230 [Clostridiaceae bacterium]|nr:hypothetical protein [Clostridiaceae bacterium]
MAIINIALFGRGGRSAACRLDLFDVCHEAVKVRSEALTVPVSFVLERGR